MGRDIISNKWILGAVLLLLIVASGCYFFYAYTTAQHKKEAAELDEFVRQWEKDQQAQQKRSTETQEASTSTPAESDTPQNAEKTITKATAEVESTIEEETQQQSENVEAADVRVSPFGYGPFPKVPSDYPSAVVWLLSDYEELPSHAQKNFELIDRVLIKLWTSGEKGFRGASTYKGKVYPHYYNTVYVKVSEYELPDGTKVRGISRRKSGPHVNTDGVDLLNPPSHLRVLDLETSGIDPYQYLNLR